MATQTKKFRWKAWAGRAGRAALALTMSSSMAVAGCDPGSGEPEQEEDAWGVGGKADAVCPEDAPLCWQTDDVAAMRKIMAEQDNIFSGRDVKGSLTAILEVAGYLDHKLGDDALDAIGDIERELEVLPEGDLEVPEVRFNEEGEPQYPEGDFMLAMQLLRRVHTEVLLDAEGAFFLANTIELGRQVEAEHGGSGKSDETAMPGTVLDPEDFGGLSEDMMRSLQQLQDSGLFGQFAVTIYQTTGVLEQNYEVINAMNFGELGSDGLIRPSGMSREAKVEQIVNRYLWSAGLLGAGAGLASAIPVAGTAVSVSAEIVWLFKLHAQMTFEIASVYGWDIRRGDNLLKVTQMLVAEGFAAEAADIAVSNIILPLVARRLSRRFGFELADDLAARLANRGIGQLMGFFTRKGQQMVASTVLEEGLKGVGKGLLTWATLGVAVLVSAGLDAAVTWHLARKVQTLSKLWVADLMLEGSTYLADRGHRNCAFRGLAAMAWADGEVKEGEQRLFQAYLAKPYAADEQTWFHVGQQERIDQARMLAGWQQNDSFDDVKECMIDEFQGSDAEHRISLLGHLYTMLHVDGDEGSAEMAKYDAFRDGLDGQGWFDGSAIDLSQMAYVERAIRVTTNPAFVVDAAASEHLELTEAVLTEDLLEFIAEPNPTVAADFACGFSGQGC